MTDIQKLIRLDKYPVANVLDKILQDKTTKKNIIFATDAYKHKDGSPVEKTEQITKEMLRALNGHLCSHCRSPFRVRILIPPNFIFMQYIIIYARFQY